MVHKRVAMVVMMMTIKNPQGLVINQVLKFACETHPTMVKWIVDDDDDDDHDDDDDVDHEQWGWLRQCWRRCRLKLC